MKGGILLVVGIFLTFPLGGCASFPPKETHPLELTILNCQREAATHMMAELGPDLWYPDLMRRGVRTACHAFEDELLEAQDEAVREKANAYYGSRFASNAVAVSEEALYRSFMADDVGQAFRACMEENRNHATQGGNAETLRALLAETAGQCLDRTARPPLFPSGLPNAESRRETLVRHAVDAELREVATPSP